MKKIKSYRDRIRRTQLNDGSIEKILEIKSVNQISKERPIEIKIQSDTMPSVFHETLPNIGVKNSQLLAYIKALEEENRKLNFEIFSVKEENSQLCAQNKDLQIKNTSQQSYITRLNVEISKLQRNLYQASSEGYQGKGRSLSRKVNKSERFVRSVSNSNLLKKPGTLSFNCSGLSPIRRLF